MLTAQVFRMQTVAGLSAFFQRTESPALLERAPSTSGRPGRQEGRSSSG